MPEEVKCYGEKNSKGDPGVLRGLNVARQVPDEPGHN